MNYNLVNGELQENSKNLLDSENQFFILQKNKIYFFGFHYFSLSKIRIFPTVVPRIPDAFIRLSLMEHSIRVFA